jgi:hypothetical protein
MTPIGTIVLWRHAKGLPIPQGWRINRYLTRAWRRTRDYVWITGPGCVGYALEKL